MSLSLFENAMRFADISRAGARRVLPVPYFREYPPLRLRNQVSGQGEKTSSSYCIAELTVFLACMKKADFDEAGCVSEFEKYSQCCTREKAHNLAVRKASKEGLLGTEGRTVTKRQVNRLMSLYPQPGARNAHTPNILPEMQYSDPLVQGKQKNSS